MKKLLLSIAIATALTGLTACNPNDYHKTAELEQSQKKQNSENIADNLKIQIIKKPISKSNLNFDSFDWTKIAKSNAEDVTTIQLPEGMKLVDIEPDSPYQVSDFLEEVTLNLYDGDKSYSETGDLAYFDIDMIEQGETFDKALFDSETAKYMQSLGAVKLFDGVVPAKVVTELKSIEGMSSYEYMTGNTETAHLRQYALNHKDGIQSFYQIVSDDTHGQIGILELLKNDGIDGNVDGNNGNASNSATNTATNITKNTTTNTVAKDSVATNKTPQSEAEATAPPPAKTSADMQTQLEANGKAIVNIHFDPAKTTIKAKNRKIINEIYSLLKNNPELKLSIEGHTDDVGNAEYNLRLSKQRAESVKNSLVKRGIDSSRLKTEGHGESKPMIPNSTMNNRAANRRVELVQFQ
ncbi:MAG: hypothetical protein CR966_00355 [Pseudomonadales bacterium]|nr:MAG: hypothetical protein CR966_00355 [Pseudomonadales bacterium]